MALIVDPDLLSDSAADDNSTEIFINTATKRIKLNTGVGDLVAADGVTAKAVYSFLKEEWKDDPLSKNLAAFPFPMQPITDEFYNLVDGWDWEDATARQSIRAGGWAVFNESGGKTQHWAPISALSAQATDQLYYDLGSGSVDFTFPGAISEAIQVQDDPNGDGNFADGFDNSTAFDIYNRQQGQIYSFSNLDAIGVPDLLAPKVFAFPVPSATDLNIAENDATIAGSAPYTGMSITFHSTAQARDIGGTNRDFGIIIDGNNGSTQEIYEFVQWAIRQATDQDSDVSNFIGDVMPELLEFVGSTLKTKSASNPDGGGDGVYIDNFQPADTNSLVFVDNGATERVFPFVAAGSLEFNAALVGDTDAIYALYFTDGVNAGSEWGVTGGVLIDDNSGADIAGSVSGNASIAWDFDYDGNNQAGRTVGTDVNVTAIAIGLNTGQYVRTTATITRSNANTITFVAPQERNYANP